MRLRILALVGVLAVPCAACINDRDTLAQEVAAQKDGTNGLPSVARAITGHFDRNPPLYYSMRLERVAQELKKTPARLDLYDDAGAAADRLGRSREALEWMARKKQQLETQKLDAQTRREHEYRYLANAGTFHAHLWLREGANRQNTAQLQTGRNMIAQAVKLKPDAHFGRERYQLLLMEWILNPPAPPQNGDMARDFLNLTAMNQDDGENRLKDSSHSDALTGLVGLIVLGDAWASFDVYHALMQGAAAQGNSPLAILAFQRCRELADNGAKSFAPRRANDVHPLIWRLNRPQTIENEKDIRRKYFELRADAIERREQRDSFMIQKMQKGQHPDTHPHFWNGWSEPAAPDYSIPDSQAKTKRSFWQLAQPWLMPICLALVALLSFSFGKKRGQKQSAKL